MGEILAAYPAARLGLFRRYHIGGCQACGYKLEDTLEQVSQQFHIADPIEAIARVIRESSEAEAKLLILPSAAPPQGHRFLDVRTPEEFRKGHLPGARLLTVELTFEILDSWPKDTPLVVYSDRGQRSLEKASYFLAYGFTTVRNLSGGLEAWEGELEAGDGSDSRTASH